MTVAELQSRLDDDEQDYLAQECERFGAHLENDLERLDQIQQAEREWRAILAQFKNANPEFDRSLTHQFAQWLKRAEGRLQQLQVQKDVGCRPLVADRFEERVEESREILATRSRLHSSAQSRRAMLAEEK